MDGNLVGLAAVIMIFGIPMAAMYTFYHVRKLRTEERLAALARGVNVPMQPELSEAARSRRSGTLLVMGALGYMLTFGLIARAESDAWIAAKPPSHRALRTAGAPSFDCASRADSVSGESLPRKVLVPAASAVRFSRSLESQNSRVTCSNSG